MEYRKHRPGRILAVLALVLAAVAGLGAQETRIITDMAGRKVTIPRVVNRTFSVNPIGTVGMYTLNPAKIAALNGKPQAADRFWLEPDYLNLPVWGAATGSLGTVNLEALIAGKPDVVFVAPLDPSQLQVAKDIETRTGIPVVMLDQDLSRFEEFYLLLGDVTGEMPRARQLADWTRKAIDRARSLAASVPASSRPRVYYAEGPEGLQTDPEGSFHTQVLDLLGGINVAQVPKKSSQGGIVGMSTVDFEQLVRWKPDLVIVSGNVLAKATGDTLAQMRADPRWQTLPAVKAGKIFQIPPEPFDWFDRPPSANRLAGLVWMGEVLYGKGGRPALEAEVREFFRLFYRIDLDKPRMDRLLKGALP